MMRLILASSSERRQKLLKAAGIEFEVLPSGVEESIGAGERPEAYAARVAREKALRVAASAPLDSLVLGADTVVVVDGQVLGKPAGAEDARRMLRLLSGRTHCVHTGVSIVRPPQGVEAEALETTLVTFRSLDEPEIEGYLASEEPYDKAGAYAIQGRGSRFATRIEGCYTNVVGLPVARVVGMLKPLLFR